MDIHSYKFNFKYTTINYSRDYLEHQSFVRFDDADNGAPGTLNRCGKKCKKHDFTVTS